MTLSLCKDDIYGSQRDPVGDCLRWSRHFNAGSRSPKEVSTHTNPSIEKNGHTQVHPYLKPNNQPSDSVTEVYYEVLPLEKQASSGPEGDFNAGEETSEDPPEEQQTEQSDDLKKLHASFLFVVQNAGPEDFQTLADLTEEVQEIPEEKAVRRFLRWCSDTIREYYERKIIQSLIQEEKEGHYFYPTTFYCFHPMTRAEREKQKRKMWRRNNRWRQTLMEYLEAKWKEGDREEEQCRVEKEQSQEKCVVEDSPEASYSGQYQPGKKMSIWDKNCSRATDYVLHEPAPLTYSMPNLPEISI